MHNPFKKKKEMSLKDVIITDVKKSDKPFTYQKNKISLGFHLDPESVKDLSDFKELLEKAIIDVDKQIEKAKRMEEPSTGSGFGSDKRAGG